MLTLAIAAAAIVPDPTLEILGWTFRVELWALLLTLAWLTTLSTATSIGIRDYSLSIADELTHTYEELGLRETERLLIAPDAVMAIQWPMTRGPQLDGTTSRIHDAAFLLVAAASAALPIAAVGATTFRVGVLEGFATWKTVTTATSLLFLVTVMANSWGEMLVSNFQWRDPKSLMPDTAGAAPQEVTLHYLETLRCLLADTLKRAHRLTVGYIGLSLLTLAVAGTAAIPAPEFEAVGGRARVEAWLLLLALPASAALTAATCFGLLSYAGDIADAMGRHYSELGLEERKRLLVSPDAVTAVEWPMMPKNFDDTRGNLPRAAFVAVELSSGGLPVVAVIAAMWRTVDVYGILAPITVGLVCAGCILITVVVIDFRATLISPYSWLAPRRLFSTHFEAEVRARGRQEGTR